MSALREKFKDNVWPVWQERRICFILIYPVHQNARIKVQCIIAVALYECLGITIQKREGQWTLGNCLLSMRTKTDKNL